MQNHINMADQNTQEMNQRAENQVVHNSEKPTINYRMITILILGFLFLISATMFIFRLGINKKIAPIISEPDITVMPTDFDDIRVGDEESYIDISTCDQWTQFVINKKNLPLQMIHSCKSSKENLDSESVYLVDILYGPADDCPSGCIYKRFQAIVKLDKSLIDQLPSGPEGLLLSIWGQPPLDTIRNYSGFGCASSELEDNIEITLGRMASNYGWNLNFYKPLTCSWDEFDNIKQIINKRSLTMSGSMFVYHEKGEERWNQDGLIVSNTNVAVTVPSNTPFKPSPVVLKSIAPSSATYGTRVIIRGVGFTSRSNDIAFTSPNINFQGKNTGYLNSISSPDGTTLSFNIPDNNNVLLGACAFSQMKVNEACPAIGLSLPKDIVQISVINKNGVSNSITLTVK